MLSIKGELSSIQIISLVLTIAGLIVILIFLGLLYADDGQQDRELCKLSVLTRATAPMAFQALVPLKCTTEKICITGKGECPEFAGEKKNVREVRLKGDALEQRRMIEETMANAMYDCWNVMGRGKLNIFGTASDYYGLGTGNPTCVVCSRVAFNAINNDISSTVDIDAYLRSANVSGTQRTYVNVFQGESGVQTFAAVEKLSEENGFKLIVEDKIKLQASPDSNQVAFVFSQVKVKDTSTVLANLGVAAAGATFAIPGAAKVGSALFLRNPYAAGAGLALGGLAAGGVAYNNWQSKQAAAGYCGELTTSAGDDKESMKNGCSVVQGVLYNVQDINMLCPGSIQGNP
ncbi:MAG: hypothetical protein AABY02_03745 [Nanoarchaeota archaeon]